jgi:uncharacterized membrane protein YgcG
LKVVIVLLVLAALVFMAVALVRAFKPKKKAVKTSPPGGKTLEYPSTYRSAYAASTRTQAKREGGSVTKPTTSKPKSSTRRRDDDDYEYAPSYVYYDEPSTPDFDSGTYTYEAPSSSDNSSDNSNSSDYGSGGSDYTPPSYSSDYSSSSYSDSGSSSSYDSGSSYSSSSYDSGSSSSYDSGSSSSYDSGSSSSYSGD